MRRYQTLGPFVLVCLLVDGCQDSSGNEGADTWQGEITHAGDTTFVHTTSGYLLGDLGTVAAESLEVVYAGEGVLQSTVVAAAGDRLLIGEATQIVVIDETGAVDTLGRQGDGPGEFRQIVGVRSRGDTIEVLDFTANRFTRLPPGATPTTSTIDAPAGYAALLSSRLPDCQGTTLVIWTRGMAAKGGPPDTVAAVWWSPGSQPNPWLLVESTSWTAWGNVFGPRFPFGPRALIASDGGCRVASTGRVA